MNFQRFEFSKGTSSKFWEIALHEASFAVRFGRIGTRGQEKTKTFPTAEKARAEHDQIVAEKLSKGYRRTDAGSSGPAPAVPARPRPSPVGEPVVYDKAKFHYQGDYPKGLDPEQAFVHTGLYLGWLIDRDLVSDEISVGDVRRFKSREITGPEVYRIWDGRLVDDMLSDEGNAFSADYFDFDRGEFLSDYEELLGEHLPSLYHVADTWENYERLRKRIDHRYAAWKRWKGSVKPP